MIWMLCTRTWQNLSVHKKKINKLFNQVSGSLLASFKDGMICLFGLEEIQSDGRGITAVCAWTVDRWLETRDGSDLSKEIEMRWELFRLTVPFSVLIM